ncbi:hypothetical protein [Robertkochia aurantiaca]|uniref:hypothetical protein n=1 Tax=Robertkochia aurantiaca TaxID=2873700 RepID=UPI001CCF7E6C|nr:hypothetical protein [Robertkochia sp. 3YJGBD-33]
MRKIVNFYLDASIHVAFAVFALVQVTGLNLGFEADPNYSWALFFGTIVSYNFIKYATEAEKYIYVRGSYVRAIQVFSFLCFAAGLWFFFKIDQMPYGWFIAVLLLVLLYSVPLRSFQTNLRNFKGIKIYLVALAWTLCTVVLPWSIAKEGEIVLMLTESVQRFMMVVILTIPFEIRDLQKDDPRLATLPQQFGLKGAKKIGLMLLLIFLSMTFVKQGFEGSEMSLRVEGVVAVVMAILLLGSKKNQVPYYESLLVESVPLFWWLLLLLFDL